jgi:hypothetical protein
MKKIPDYIKSVEVDSTGEVTQSRYLGMFKVKVVLTNSDKTKIERYYKEELPDDTGVPEDRRINAGVIAELRARVIEGPAWWTGSREGRDMVEMQPLYDLMVKTNEAYKSWLTELQKEADATK